jgi:hypothetical protein
MILHPTIFSTSDADFTQHEGSILDYCSAMRHLSNRIIKIKENNFLLNTGIYKRQLDSGASLRCLANHYTHSIRR